MIFADADMHGWTVFFCKIICVPPNLYVSLSIYPSLFSI